MELRHMRYFVAVAEALSFRKAAERLHIAQPALSKQVRDLERDVGARLLDRNTRGVSLTDSGSVFLDEARDILERVDMASSAARDVSTGHSGKLLIATLGAITGSFLPAALSEFRTRYPKVDVNISDLSMQEQMNAVKAGTVQIGFFLHDYGISLPTIFESMVVMESRAAIALCYQHRLATAADVSLADLIDEQLLCIASPGRTEMHRQRIQTIFSNHGVPFRPIKQVGSYESLMTMISGNHGVSVLSQARAGRVNSRIVYKQIRDQGEDLRIKMSVFWRKGTGSQLARNFVEVLRSLPHNAERE